MKALLAALSLALLLGGCENSMQTEVTQFTTMAGPPVGHSFAVSAEPAQNGNLEFQYYAGLVGGALQDHGFTAAPANAQPDLIVVLHYGSAGNHTDLWTDPYCCGWGWRHHGPWGPETSSTTYYAESLEVQIFDGAAWRNNLHTMLYQGRAIGDARINDISAAVPALVKALFLHFPGNSGQTERVTVPVSEDSKPIMSPAPPAPMAMPAPAGPRTTI